MIRSILFKLKILLVGAGIITAAFFYVNNHTLETELDLSPIVESIRVNVFILTATAFGVGVVSTSVYFFVSGIFNKLAQRRSQRQRKHNKPDSLSHGDATAPQAKGSQ